MSAAIQQRQARAPRYRFRPDDSRLIRCANPGQSENAFSTTTLNVSATGLAFRVERSLSPQIGEVIMIEFTVPGGEQMACFSRVVRIEEPREQWKKNYSDEVIVAVRFGRLGSGQKERLALGIGARLAQLQRHYRWRNWYNTLSYIAEHRWQFIWITLSLVATAFIFSWVLTPSGNYSPLHYIPWGARKFF